MIKHKLTRAQARHLTNILGGSICAIYEVEDPWRAFTICKETVKVFSYITILEKDNTDLCEKLIGVLAFAFSDAYPDYEVNFDLEDV